MKQFVVIGILLLLGVFVYAEENIEIDTDIVTTLYTEFEDENGNGNGSLDDDFFKHSLKCNMLHMHNEEPEMVDNLWAMFLEGAYYGRLRLNSFGFKWKNELQVDGVKLREDHTIAALGGSLIYRSAYLNGFGIGAGFYGSSAIGSLDDSEAYLYKAGKGAFSRYDFQTDGNKNLYTFAQAYLEYKNKEISLKVGRQIFESFLTKSNDTKMIPNTFEGLTLQNDDMLGTSYKMAYLLRQKLRDHSKFHHVLAAGNIGGDPYAIYSENDDSAMHFGLQKSELNARGIDDRLIVIEANNNSIENITLRMNYTAVPDLISSAMIQANYRLKIYDWSVIPALRYMQQFDDGAGEIGGANLKTQTQGYSDPDCLDTSLYGARVDVVQDAFKLRFGYTKVADEGDIIAPWRGFPTAGFTRAMAQYNWYANTESYMVQLDYEFEEISEFKVISRFAIQDFDDDKAGVQADSNVFTIDFLKGLGQSSLYLKTRLAHVVGDDDTIAGNGLTKLDPSYDEIRFEINYLF
ncbi:OprD family outer membrane porin [Sulfurovum sp.]|uniref:OprD family outer membrane porin n=1 Tax=Sulfurovum sp. TaxID=1969726 RepID=UPI002867D885|nr:OprD family outer membrane porin [Sulfurovum sp.]